MNWVKLGDYISSFKQKCGIQNTRISGIDISKNFIETRANLEKVDTRKYLLVPPLHFACNLMHIGRDERIPIALNSSDNNLIVSPAYYVFYIAKPNYLLEDYLYIFFNSEELDRLLTFYTDSSIRGNLTEKRFLELKIPLPSIEEQKKLVAVWSGLKGLKESNEDLSKPLLDLCQSYIVDLKTKYPSVKLGDYIEECNEVNPQNIDYCIMGINNQKEFMNTVANTENIDRKKYKIIKNGRFVFSGMQTGRDECIRIALYDKNNPVLISPAYTTFTIKEGKHLLPEFLFLCFKRKEMDRYGWFISDSSVRANLDWNRFLEIKIPLPPIEVQQAIVNVYKCAKESANIAQETKDLINNICLALIQKAIKE